MAKLSIVINKGTIDKLSTMRNTIDNYRKNKNLCLEDSNNSAPQPESLKGSTHHNTSLESKGQKHTIPVNSECNCKKAKRILLP